LPLPCALDEESLGRLCAMDRRHGLLPYERPAGAGGLGGGHRLCARAPHRFLRRFHRPRPGPPAHFGWRARGGARPVRRSYPGLPPRRQRAAADHHAGQRRGAVRTARPSRARGHAAGRDVAGIVELSPCPRTGRARGPPHRQTRRDQGGRTGRGRRRPRPRRRRRVRPRANRRGPPRPQTRAARRPPGWFEQARDRRAPPGRRGRHVRGDRHGRF
jgi:hypothetical protein